MRPKGHRCRFRSRWWYVAGVELDCLDWKSYPKHSAARGGGRTPGPARFNGRSHDVHNGLLKRVDYFQYELI